MRNKWRQSSAFLQRSKRIFRSWGFALDAFSGKVVIDVGAGSRMRGAVLEGARLVAVEPMGHVLLNAIAKERAKGPEAASKVAHMDFFNPRVVWRLFAQPAELRLCAVEGMADLAYTINAIDHAYDPRRIVHNMARTLRHTCDSRMVVDVDLEHAPHTGHPHSLTRAGLQGWFESATPVLRVLNYTESRIVFDKKWPGKHGTWMLGRRYARDGSAC